MLPSDYLAGRIRAHHAMARLHGRRVRTGRLPKQIFPRAIEAGYAREIVAIVESTKPAIARLHHELPDLLRSSQVARGDALELRLDVGEVQRARAIIDQARAALDVAVSAPMLERLAERYARATSLFQRAQLARQIKAAVGIDIIAHDRTLPALVEHFVGENVALIKSLGEQSLGDIEKIVARAFTTGQRAEAVQNEIADRYGVHERHARLIARDQIGSLNGQINASRQRELGVRKFRWRNVHDARVRPLHVRFERESELEPYSYDNLPIENGRRVKPGEPPLCRCHGEPVFDDLLAAIGV